MNESLGLSTKAAHSLTAFLVNGKYVDGSVSIFVGKERRNCYIATNQLKNSQTFQDLQAGLAIMGNNIKEGLFSKR